MEEGQRIELCRAVKRGTVFKTVGHHCRLPSMVVDDGLEPSRRTNQVLIVYKAMLHSRAIDNYYFLK